jgi:hypothetical protein
MRKPSKSEQLNVRFTPSDIEALEVLALKEERDKSELVRFFVRWGLKQYRLAGSVDILKVTDITPALRSGGNVGGIVNESNIARDIEESATLRLQLRKEAERDNGEATARSPQRSTIKIKRR